MIIPRPNKVVNLYPHTIQEVCNHPLPPEGANGYTKPGYYGDVDGTYSSGYSGSGKGWVYSADELHVIGLPEGEDGYTLPGWYGDID